MMYPFLKLDDETEIVHSEMLPDGQVKVYMEQPADGGFNSATCMLPGYVWSDIEGYSPEQIDRYREVIESTAHLILKYATTGGYSYASGFLMSTSGSSTSGRTRDARLSQCTCMSP